MAVDLKSAPSVSPDFGAVVDSHPSLRLNVQLASLDTPARAPAEPLPALAGAGVSLTRWVILILAAVLALLLVAAFLQEQQLSAMLGTTLQSSAAAIPDGIGAPEATKQVKARQDLLKAYQGVADASREFWLKLGQMILLNLLLPILTALLGYVFGSRHCQK